MKKIFTAILCLGFAGSGCASASQSMRDVSKRVEDQTGYKYETNKNVETTTSFHQEEPLTLESAVQLAFRNNPALKGRLEGLGVSSAEISGTALPRNPVIEGSILYPEHGDGEITEISIEQNLLSLLLLPMKSQVAGAQYRQLEYSLSQELAGFAFDVKKAYYLVLAAEQKLKLRQAVLETTDAAAELAGRQREAGNVNEFFLQNEIAVFLESKLAVAQAQAEVNLERQHLSDLLGFPERRSDWKLLGELPYIQSIDPVLDGLGKKALNDRVDLLAARKEVEIRKKNVFLSGAGILDDVDVGYRSEKELDGERLDGPSIRAGVPIFDLGRNAVLGAEARVRQSEHELAALENQVVSEVALAHGRLLAARNSVEEYNNSIIPAKAKIVEEMQKHQNYMLIGVYALLAAKRDEINAREQYIDSLQEYWVSRSELERAVGRALPLGESMKQATAEKSEKSEKNDHSQHGGM